MDLPDLYKDIVKHLRVVRNVARGHKEALGTNEIQHDCMTPYERGRMTRSCTRLGDRIHDLIGEPSQAKIAFSFMTYMVGLGINGSAFSKPGIGTWSKLWQLGQQYILDENITHDHFITMVSHVGGMLDQPLADVPDRVMLMKLSIS